MSPATIALAALLERCAPNIGPRTMTAIVRVESNAQPLAIHDNTTGRSYAPANAAAATATASLLIAAGHSVDLGLVQVNSANLVRVGLRLRDAFDPCANLHAGATILAAAYAQAARAVGPGPFALRRAIGAYNTGSIFAGTAYLDRILVAAGLRAEDSRLLPDLEAPGVVARPPAGPLRVAALRTTPQNVVRVRPSAPSNPGARPGPATAVPAQQSSPDPYRSDLIVTSVAPTPRATPAP